MKSASDSKFSQADQVSVITVLGHSALKQDRRSNRISQRLFVASGVWHKYYVLLCLFFYFSWTRTQRERESILDGQELFAEVVIVCMGIYTVLVVGSDN